MPKSGLGYTFCCTSAATTVEGTLTVYHPVGANLDDEMISPGLSTLQDDCSDQPSRKASPISGTGEAEERLGEVFVACVCDKPSCEIRRTTRMENENRICFIRPLLYGNDSAQHSYHALLTRFNRRI